MSYRSVKRVLGETSLERKCRFLFGACLLLLITGSFLWYGRLTEQVVWTQNRTSGRQSVEEIVAKIHWLKLETNEGFRDTVVSKLVNPADGAIFEVDPAHQNVKLRRQVTVRGFPRLEPGTRFAVYDEATDVTSGERKGMVEVTSVLTRPDGEIIAVTPPDGTAVKNATEKGAADKGTSDAATPDKGTVRITIPPVSGFTILEPGAVFAVYSDSGGVTSGDRKGMVRVTQVLGPTQAEARILEQAPGYQIKPKDKLFRSLSGPDEASARIIEEESGNKIQAKDKILSPMYRYRWEPIRLAINRTDERGKPKDKTEEEFLEAFSTPPSTPSSDGQPPFEEREDVDKHEYHYYQPIYASRECVTCHRSLVNKRNPLLAENDLLSIIHVRMPTNETYKALRQNRAMLLTTAIITVFLAMIALYVIVRYVIVKPLKHLRDVSDEISRGNIALRADIHTSDEFEQLGTAFNRMLQKILDSAQELRHLNDHLDAKVDELAQANMRLFEMNRLKSDFLATMSHELRTPLNSIIGFSDVLNSIDSLDTKQRRYVQNIQKSGRLLLEMINDILDLAKIESGKMELNLTRFRIDAVVCAQCDMARPLAERKNVDLDTQVDADIPELYQDQAKLQQILNNLLSNAIKFTPEGGRVDVAARVVQRDRLELVVRDTGVGIADEDQTVIFEKFRQGKSALSGGDAMTREYSGTGLGLSIVKELCKLLGGEISLVSELGKGSTFTVRLPIIREEQPKLESPLASELDDLGKARPEVHRLRDDPLVSSEQ
ncbi:MAG: HAMP domain-containing protein [Planctomycetia bacterium]|nr:HAMP domain-containing protein [Planctomycetia bacterium]